MLRKTAIAASVSVVLVGLAAPTVAVAKDKEVVTDKATVVVTVPTTKTIHPKKPDF